MIEKFHIKNDRALGIHISESRISFALVKHDIGEIRLVKAGHIAVPEKAIENGFIKDPALLGKTLKTLLDRNGIRNRQAYISLLARPVISQIIDLPRYIPSNMAKFVQSEIRHSAVLSGKEPQYDFCGIGSSMRANLDRIYVAATNKEKISTLLKACSAAKVEPLSIELPTIAALRALYKKKIVSQPDVRSLVVLIQKSMVTLCVLSRGHLDLIRNIDMQSVAGDQNAFLEKCFNEIEMIFQFYELEVEQGTSASWQVIFQTETRRLSPETLQHKLGERANTQLCICSDETIYEDISIKKCKSIEAASITAIGLALKTLESNSLGIEINLLPPEAMEMTSAKKYCLVTANIAAVVLLLMFIIGGMVRVRLSNTENQLKTIKSTGKTENIEHLLIRQRTLTEQITRLDAQRNRMGEFYNDGNIQMWTELLDEIRDKTPKSLCILHLVSTDNEKLSITGYGLSYKSIHLFADLLRDSKNIESVKVIETNKSTQFEGYVTYSLDCRLFSPRITEVQDKEETDNAS